MNQRSVVTLALLLFAAAAIGFFAAHFTQDGGSTSSAETDVAEPAVAYWVAPMDPNFRSDKPGKSPMGMDLVPVYEGESSGPGQIEIYPGFEFSHCNETVQATVFPVDGIRQAPMSPIDGKPMKRASSDVVQSLLEHR